MGEGGGEGTIIGGQIWPKSEGKGREGDKHTKIGQKWGEEEGVNNFRGNIWIFSWKMRKRSRLNTEEKCQKVAILSFCLRVFLDDHTCNKVAMMETIVSKILGNNAGKWSI